MPASAKRPFWLHQVAEYIIGLAAIATGVQSPEPLVPALIGGLVLVNAAVVDGPLGAFRLVGRRTHRLTDIVVLVAMALSVVVPGLDVSTRLTQGALAVVFAVVVMGTDYRAPVDKRRSESGSRATEIGRTSGRVVGTLAARVRDRARHETQ